MATILKDDQQVTASVEYVDRRGHPADVDEAPSWSSSDETILTVTPDPDGMSALIVAAGGIGSAQITVTADADLGDGVKPLTAVGDFEVLAGEAFAGNFVVGTPENQP